MRGYNHELVLSIVDSRRFLCNCDVKVLDLAVASIDSKFEATLSSIKSTQYHFTLHGSLAAHGAIRIHKFFGEVLANTCACVHGVHVHTP